jgi:ABC-type multidrug transport system fused ATPase/permease subunit
VAERLAARFTANYKAHGKVGRALVATFGRPYLLAGLYKLPHDCCVFISPMLLKLLIKLLEEERPRLSDGLLVVGAILVTGLLQSLCLQQYFHRVYRVSYQTMAALNVAIYEKSLVISNTARAATTVGLTVNLISVDVETIASLCTYFQNLLWSAWFQIAVSMVMLYGLLGVSVLAGLATMFVLMGLNVRILRLVNRAQKANLKAKDERVKAVAEVLHAMRPVKARGDLRPKASPNLG